MFTKATPSTSTERSRRRLLQISIDLLCAIVGVSVASQLASLQLTSLQLLPLIGGISCFRVGILYSLGAYRQLWRYLNPRDIQNILINLFVVSVLLSVASLVVPFLTYDFIILEAALFFIGTLSVRSGRSAFYPQSQTNRFTAGDRPRVLLIGAGMAANSLISDIRKTGAPLVVVGCLDDDSSKIGAVLHNVPILGTTNRLENFVEKFNIEKIIIAIPSATPEVIGGFVSRVRRLHISMKVIPSIKELMRHKGEQMNFNIKLSDLKDAKEFQTFTSTNETQDDLVLVTGGAGYIGLHLIEKLLADGKKVRVLENFSFGKDYLPDYFKHENVELIQGDIAHIGDVVRAVKGVQTIVALAAIVGDPACSINPEETLNINYEATKVLVEAANFYGVKRIIFASSCSVYGESDKELLTENSPLNPVSLYAKTRIMSEDVIFNRCGSVEPVVLRLSTVFGFSKRMRYDLVVNTLVVRALVDKAFKVFGGNQWRPFVHCNDVAKAFYLAVNAPSEKVSGEVFNLGSNDMNFTISQIGDIVHKRIPDSDYSTSDDIQDPRNYRVDFTKIKTVLGFEKEYSIEDGIEEIISEIESNPDLAKYTEGVYSNLQVQKERNLVTR